MIIDVNTKHSGQQKTRADAGGEQLDNRGVRRDAVNDHGDRRRNEIVERAFRRNQRRGKPLAVSRFAHARIGQGADGGGCGRRYARNRAEQRRKTKRCHGDMRPEAADHGRDPAQKPVRDTAARHQVSSEYEERHRQQRVFVEAVEDVLMHHRHRQIEEKEQDHQRSGQQQQENRKAQQQQHEGQDRHHPIHRCPFTRICRRYRSGCAPLPRAP